MTYKQCSRCIMDNRSDRYISFDSKGYCNYCTAALNQKSEIYFPNSKGTEKLKTLIDKLIRINGNNKYDCVMGISGGLDSSYLAYLGAVKWGLRILAVHVNDGFNSEISERNIERISKFPNLDLHTVHLDENQYVELIKAYMRASVPNIAIPQDNILFASVYKFAKENNVKVWMSGFNFSLESILQIDKIHTNSDLENIMHIHKLYGKGAIDKLEFTSGFKADLDNSLLRLLKPRPLNFIDFNKDRSLEELNEYCGFEYYGEKHQENHFTKFALQYWMYHKFNVDIRSSYLSSLIVSEQITREEALLEYKKPAYEEESMQKTIDFVLTKLQLSRAELQKLMEQPNRNHEDFKTYKRSILTRVVLKIFRIINKKKLQELG